MAIPIPRNPGIDLTHVPRRWVADNPVATAITNGVNMLFPHGERFFVRSVHHYLDQISDPTLLAQVKAFFKQEGHHAHAHDEFNDVLRSHGYDVDTFLARYEAIGGWLEAHTPPKLNLAGTAAAEHFTAIMASGAFENDVLSFLHPTMQQLMSWHAAEEIEHKAVAFDVLKSVDDSYWLRMAGLAHATIMLSSFWLWGTLALLRQDKLGWRGLRGALRKMKQPSEGPIAKRVFWRGIKQYIRRDFHPSHNADEHLARAWFAKRGMEWNAA